MSKNIIITGASGLIGTRLTEMLMESGYSVRHLGRTKKSGIIPGYVWDIEKGILEEEVFENATAVVHLAGAGVADKRWTTRRKQEILNSRIASTALLGKYLRQNPAVKTVVAASAIGYYGFGKGEEIYNEACKPGNDFLANVVKKWEDEIDKIEGPRVVKIRIGIVLSKKGGALKEIMKPVQWSIGAPLGTGNQFMSWIHIDDLCNMFIKALETESWQGVYNGTGTYAVTNQELTIAIAQALGKPLWLPPVPTFVLNLMLGEMAGMVVNGSIVSSAKIQQAGFTFHYPTLEQALENLLQ